MGGEKNSPTSSIDSSSHPCLSSTSVSRAGDLSTDLRLGLSISASSLQATSPIARLDSRPEFSDWPPITPQLRSRLARRGNHSAPTFFVKVYMEGVPIGRKLDLYAHHDYDSLIRTLCLMFGTRIILTPELAPPVSPGKAHVLTYEDKEGDWMMVGDVPWQLFLATVKRLKIARADRC